MKPKTPAPATAPSVADSAALAAKLNTDIAALKGQIAEAEATRDAQALELDDTAFEASVLETERAKRQLLRLQKQLEAAKAQHAEAEAREAENRRATLYEAGLRAIGEVERLTDEYGRRAEAVTQVLRQIHTHSEAIRLGNDNRPDYAPWIEPRGLHIHQGVVLPDAADAYEYVWRGEGSLYPTSRETGSEPPFTVLESSPQPVKEIGPRKLTNGGTAFVAPPCDWGKAAQ